MCTSVKIHFLIEYPNGLKSGLSGSTISKNSEKPVQCFIKNVSGTLGMLFSRVYSASIFDISALKVTVT